MSTDRELLELVAKAQGLEIVAWIEHRQKLLVKQPGGGPESCLAIEWNPLTDDGDALRLGVKLNLDIRYESYDAGVAVIVGGAWDGAPEAVHEIFERDGPRAVRLAITRAAAEVGRAMQ